MTNKYLLNEAARLAGIRGYQISYAITQGYIEEPKETINRQRLFTDEDICRIKKYFANRPKRGCPSRAIGEKQ